jgi:hypothetical protein
MAVVHAEWVKMPRRLSRRCTAGKMVKHSLTVLGIFLIFTFALETEKAGEVSWAFLI